MKYNFDEIVNRWNTDSVKYDGPKMERGYTNYIPMWVADMDFKTPQPIVDDIRKRLDDGVLGYTFIPQSWSDAIINWTAQRYNWKVDADQIIYTPGVVRGISFVVNCFTKPSDRVMVMSPVYPPFFNVTQANAREVVYHRLLNVDGRYEIDFEQFEKDVQGCKLFILCNPHNPGGRVWSVEELQKIARICHQYKVIVISDEIHADLTLPSHSHPTFATMCDEAADISVVFMAPSKAFNMPGVASSYGIIVNPTLREKYRNYVESLDVCSGNMFSYTALVAAYTRCEGWLDQLLPYLQSNIDFVYDFITEKMPKLKMVKPEASYLIFLDCRGLGMDDAALEQFFYEKAGLLLNPGNSFGPGGEGHMRLNVGCPRSVVEQAMNQLLKAYQELA